MSFHHLFDANRPIYPSKRLFGQNIVGHTNQLQAQTTGSMSVISFVEVKVKILQTTHFLLPESHIQD
jgi:hypothetical protein